jgi:hypothetical protein
MNRTKKLFQTTIKGYDKVANNDIEFSVFGIFDTIKVRWDYYVISAVHNSYNKLFLTEDICGRYIPADIESLAKYGKKFATKEEGQTFIEEFKIKFESGSNNTQQEVRDKKIDEILGGDKTNP